MKRVVLLLGFGLVCIGAVYYAAPRYVAARKTADQNAGYARMLMGNGPLVLDSATQAIFVNADRVETFRLVDPNADSDESSMPVSSWPRGQFMGGCQVMHVGPAEGRDFAAALQMALARMPSPGDMTGQSVPGPNDSGSDVGFRVWRGKAHADIYVGLNTGYGEIISEDAHHKPLMRTAGYMGGSRPALLALSRQAFPQDTSLAELGAR